MSDDIMYLVASAILTWAALLAASLIHAKGWTMPGFRLALGNRDDMPPRSAFAGRADRAAKNLLETLVLFVAVLAAAHFSNRTGPTVDLGAAIYFWTRLAFWPVYLAGIVYLRTLLWTASIVGMGLIVFALLT